MLGLYGDNGKEHGNYYDGLCKLEGSYWTDQMSSLGSRDESYGRSALLERSITLLKEIEFGVYYWGYIGIMEKKMETTIQDLGYSPPQIDRIWL